MATLTTNVESLAASIDPETAELALRIDRSIDGGASFTVESAADVALATDKVKALRVLLNGPTPDRSSVKETFDPLTQMAHRLHKMIVQARDKHAGKIEVAIRHYTGAADAWIREQKRIEAEEQARIMREQYEAERKERSRLEAEARAKQSLEQAAAEEERNKAIFLAQKYGVMEVVEELRQEQAAPAEPVRIDESRLMQFRQPVLVQTAVPTGTQRKRLTFRVDDPSRIPACYLLPADDKQRDPLSYPRIRDAVKATGFATMIPGITVIEDTKTILK